VDEVKSFKGIAGCNRWFIRNLSQITYPIASLQRKGKKFEWIEACATSFDKFNQLLIDALMLNIADPDKQFMM